MSGSSDQRFRRSERLRLRKDFARVFATRCSRADRAVVIYVAPNDLSWSRLGLSVSKRVGNAVRRNYIRRKLREAFRTQKSELPKGLDIICVARPEVTDERSDLGRSLRSLVLSAAQDLARKGKAPLPSEPGREQKHLS